MSGGDGSWEGGEGLLSLPAMLLSSRKPDGEKGGSSISVRGKGKVL